MSNVLNLNGRATARGRYVLSPKTTVEIAPGERTGIGTMPGKPEELPVLVHETTGGGQKFVPAYAVAFAIGTGKVLSADEIVGCFREAGNLSKLAAAVTAAQAKIKKDAAGAGA